MACAAQSEPVRRSSRRPGGALPSYRRKTSTAEKLARPTHAPPAAANLRGRPTQRSRPLPPLMQARCVPLGKGRAARPKLKDSTAAKPIVMRRRPCPQEPGPALMNDHRLAVAQQRIPDLCLCCSWQWACWRGFSYDDVGADVAACAGRPAASSTDSGPTSSFGISAGGNH
ncbi:hypothetical protein ACCO45_014005 [Purpureocillium lilacinum]|uniref:Uncharacterized protein n=1 Tax=Purpureocillium lilacinum TaxID=33203 RepID=A0ACC4D887_PURLI